MKKVIVLVIMWIMMLAAVGVFAFLVYDHFEGKKEKEEAVETDYKEPQSISGKVDASSGDADGKEGSGKGSESGNTGKEEKTTEEKSPEIIQAETDYPLADPWHYKILDLKETDKTVKLVDAETVMAEAEEKQKQELAELEMKGEKPMEEEIPIITIYNPLELTPLPTASNPPGPEDDLTINGFVYSTNLVLVDADTGDIVVQREADDIIYPASMIKVLTVLVAADYIHDWSDTYEIKGELLDYAYSLDCSCVGFLRGETVTVRDLFYGTIVCSGADACLSLADYCCGGEKEFVRRMNLKLEELGLSDTAHVTNCVGYHEETQYCTVKDMAVIMSAAMQNSFVTDALAQLYSNVPPDEMVEEGIQIANAFMCRIENELPGGEVKGAKTGYSPKIGFNAVSWYETKDGHKYICVTVNCDSTWQSIYDHMALYRNYT